MQGLRSLWSPLLMTLALLCYNKGPSAFCQQNFRTALTFKYSYGLNSFNCRSLRSLADLTQSRNLHWTMDAPIQFNKPIAREKATVLAVFGIRFYHQ